MAHCLGELKHSMELLPHHKPPLKVLDRVRRSLAVMDSSSLAGMALHDFIDELQVELEAVHVAISSTWFTPTR